MLYLELMRACVYARSEPRRPPCSLPRAALASDRKVCADFCSKFFLTAYRTLCRLPMGALASMLPGMGGEAQLGKVALQARFHAASCRSLPSSPQRIQPSDGSKVVDYTLLGRACWLPTSSSFHTNSCAGGCAPTTTLFERGAKRALWTPRRRESRAAQRRPGGWLRRTPAV